jgi:hypothetical protein
MGIEITQLKKTPNDMLSEFSLAKTPKGHRGTY